ncbi:glycine--tRNA ligase subunit beta [Salipaludibacillus sp. CF4.18]|uniref:glycine--tRNA ligase subunit beta n=1 Tax=Salipaludibacillus sp. CF4.18 TaxID=3373081 RepID=UPI003EE78727
MNNQSLLLEVGLEEMPARFVTDAMNNLSGLVEKWLKENRLRYNNIEAYSTPRRLAIVIKGLEGTQRDIEEEAKGPSKKIAMDESGNWSKAAQGFARGQKVSVDDLFFKELKGEEYVFVKKHVTGQKTVELLPQLKDVILRVPFPKNMKWGANDLRYVRPVKWLVALYGSEVIPFEITNVHTGNETIGHRFLGTTRQLADADSYVETLLSEHVMVNPMERKEAIRTQIERIAESEDWVIPIDDGLLEEVNNLVEYPTALFGNFDERFLKVPDEVLITSMREHQRYFPVKNKAGELLPHFVTVRNGDHRHLENVQKGNEKVLRARLADSEFFYQEDLKKSLDSRLPRLEAIVYHEKLGSVGDKVRRIEEISEKIAVKTGASPTQLNQTKRAAQLAKADLVTHMVNEFPELEGRMGEEYALKFGEEAEVAKAIREHYLPKQSGDQPPSTSIGAYVSVADKLDTIVTSFGIGNIPTGSQDPHGLRRQTAAVLTIFLSQEWDVNLFSVIKETLEIIAEKGLLNRDKVDVMKDMEDFIRLRYKNMLQERGVRYDVADAVLSTEIGFVSKTVYRAEFLMTLLNTNEFKKDVEAFSRVLNIAKKANDQEEVNTVLLKEQAEITLQNKAEEKQSKIAQLLEEGNISDAYAQLKELEPVIHDYFANIMVMAEDNDIKQNRLAQMKKVAAIITSFAEFQVIVFHAEE